MAVSVQRGFLQLTTTQTACQQGEWNSGTGKWYLRLVDPFTSGAGGIDSAIVNATSITFGDFLNNAGTATELVATGYTPTEIINRSAAWFPKEYQFGFPGAGQNVFTWTSVGPGGATLGAYAITYNPAGGAAGDSDIIIFADSTSGQLPAALTGGNITVTIAPSSGTEAVFNRFIEQLIV